MTSLEDVLKAVSKKYISIHTVDIEENTYKTIKSTEIIDSLCEEASGAQEALYNVISHVTDQENGELIREFTKFSTLGERFRESRVLECSFYTGTNGWCEASFVPIDDESTDHIRHVIFMVEDVNERVLREHAVMEQAQRAEAQALHAENLASMDSLTGLLNQGGIRRFLQQINDDKSIKNGVLLTLDVDDFKLINDVYGHRTGDRVLKVLANRLRRECPKPSYIARNGGDEFMAFFANTTLKEINPFLKSFGKSRTVFTHKGKKCHFFVSMGAAEYPRHSRDFRKLREMADIALYNVKMSNKNGYQFYYDGLEKSDRAQLGFNIGDIATGLPGAVLVYKVDMNGQILFANDSVIKLVGCDNLQDLMQYSHGNFASLIDPKDLRRVRREVYEQYNKTMYDRQDEDHVDGFAAFNMRTKQGNAVGVECFGRRIINKFHGDVVYVLIYEINLKEQYVKSADQVYRQAES